MCSSDLFVSEVKLADDAVKQYYDAHQDEFKVPERARVEYLVLSLDTIAAQTEVSPEEVKRHYEENAKQFAKGEDVYSLFATAVYGRPITKANAEERFVGKTCILGLGYGTGAAKLQSTLATSQPISVKMDLDEAKRIVGVYRDKNHAIIDLWAEGDLMLEDMINGNAVEPRPFGKHKACFYDNEGIILPNGLRIRYKNLRKEWDEEDQKLKTVYDSRKGKVSIWGGTVVENVVQALARIVVGHQMVNINETYRVALTVHDAAVIVVPEDEKDQAEALVTGLMSEPPEWARGCPVACEAKIGATYGDC